MKTVMINLYSFSELEEDQKNKVIYSFTDFFNALHKENKKYYEWKSDIIEHILVNNYLFFKDGTFVPTVTYSNEHEKKRTTEYKFHDETYIIK